ncbi:MAG TPA: flagellar basal-body MS-ring/collar protein FliF [Oscillatoriaceae cyanobacterium]
MNEFFRQLGNDIARIWSQMSVNQRVLTGAVAAIAVGLLTFLIVWAQQPNYAVLFSKLSDQDAGAIVAKLKDQGIPYQLNGNAVLVPTGQVDEVRLSMASAGLPSGGTVGFSQLFDGNSWSQTDFVQQLNYQRGLEGELERTISALDGVDTARVHIVIPKDSLFLDSQEPTTASVLLTLKPGAQLDLNQARSVQHLVSKAVPNLAMKNVFITDTTGRDYSDQLAQQDPKNLAGTDLSQRQLTLKRNYERDLESRLQAMLDDVYGPGNTVVRVNTVWDFSQVQTDDKTYSPSLSASGTQMPGGILLSEKTKNERYNGSANSDGGVPGNNPNVAPDYQSVDSTNGGQYSDEEATHNYDVNEREQHLVKEPAVLRDTTVSVALNAPVQPGTNLAADPRIVNIQKMVATAAGISDMNKVFVNPTRFNTTSADQEAKADADAQRMRLLTKWGTVAAAILMAFVAFGLLLMSFRRRRSDEMAQLEEALPKLPEGDLGITLIDDEAELLSSVDKLADLPPPTPDEQRLSELQKELTAFIKAQPKDAAKLVRAWMSEDD